MVSSSYEVVMFMYVAQKITTCWSIYVEMTTSLASLCCCKYMLVRFAQGIWSVVSQGEYAPNERFPNLALCLSTRNYTNQSNLIRYSAQNCY